MLKNFLVIAVRSIHRNRLYAFINIGGLAVGMACATLIALWVLDEVRYDAFQRDRDRMYRANWDFKLEDGTKGIGPGTPPPLAAALVRSVPGVEAAIRLRLMPDATIRSGDESFNEQRLLAADSNFFQFFSFPLIEGEPSTVLHEPNSVVLTRDVARKLFGDVSPVGKTLLIDKAERNFYGTYQNLFRITGVAENPPTNSHIQFRMVTSMSSYPGVAWFNWSWVWMQVVTYVKVREGTSAASIDAQIPGLVRTFGAAGFQRLRMSYADLNKNGNYWNFVLQPFKDVYLHSSSIGNRLGPLGDIEQVRLLSVIALLVLGIACINFMNLATARSMMRTREIGIRKVLGSRKAMLALQFLVESTLFSVLALPIAILLVELSLPWFNQLSGKSIAFVLFDPPWVTGALLGLTATVGLVSGSYPAVHLSSIRPAEAVKGVLGSVSRGKLVRNLLVVAQFAMTIGIIACTFLVERQMNFVRQKDLGFDRRGIVVVSNRNNLLGGKSEAFRDALKTLPGVVDASLTTGVPPASGFQDYYYVEGKGKEAFPITSYMTDERFLGAMRISVGQGRGFDPAFDDSSSVILNEAAVHWFGLSDPIGKTLVYMGGNGARYRIIGVVRDFNFQSLYSPITPFALFHARSNSYMTPESYVLVRVKEDDVPATLRSIELLWKSVAPDSPFSYSFLDETMEAGYSAEVRLGQVFLVFSFLTILIACIGLFGLSAYSAERRRKEIGIRKVLGASEFDVLGLLSSEFMKVVLAANIVAWPIAWYVMHTWLENFAYRVSIPWWVFVAAGGIGFLVAIATVSAQTIRAASANPVKSLRYE